MLERSYVCPHTEEQRQITGTWCTPELQEAVRQKYKIIHIHEVWHFPEKQQKPGLFKEYVDTWLKIKEEASGWPAHAENDPEEQQKHLDNYYAKEKNSALPHQDREKSWLTYPGQNDVKFDVREIW